MFTHYAGRSHQPHALPSTFAVKYRMSTRVDRSVQEANRSEKCSVNDDSLIFSTQYIHQAVPQTSGIIAHICLSNLIELLLSRTDSSLHTVTTMSTDSNGPFGYPRPARTWWKESTVYQIYPASFCASGQNPNNGGYGDLQGIISKLDYIKSLGVDIIWMSPILKSPQVDMGYDISDYQDIDERYGTMQDFEELMKGVKDRGMKLVMDLVVNHSSDQHEWFQQSRKREGGKDDWYIWKPAKVGGDGERMPPNNWEAAFGGSVWEWDERRQEYYLHLFAKEQPDLNWEKEDVRKEVLGMMRWWLEKGVDGFRMDVINFISKDQSFPDAEVRKDGFLQGGTEYFACGPRLHEYLHEIGSLLKEFGAFSVGEMPGVHDEKEIIKGVAQDRGELAMAFQFEIVDMDHMPEGKWLPRKFTPKMLRDVVGKWQRFMLENGGWNALYMENHDQARTVSRYASDTPELRMISAKMLAAHLALQCGTVFVYQGQELGMASMPRDTPVEKYQDIEMLNHWKQVLRDHPKDEKLQAMYKGQYVLIGRDHARTPMQWTSGKHAGFSPENVQPWMYIHSDYEKWNAEAIVQDKDSSYHYWNKLLSLRKSEKDLFVYGDFEMLDLENKQEEVVAYVRTEDSDSEPRKKALVIASFSKDHVSWEVPEKHADVILAGGNSKLCNMLQELRNYSSENEVRDRSIKLRPFEVLVAMT